MNELMKDDNLVDSRFPSSYSKEQMKYFRSQMVKKLTEDTYDGNDFELKEDKRFTKEQNQMIREEVQKKIRELKKKIIEKMELLSTGHIIDEILISADLKEKGIFDERINKTRIRSLLKVELEK